MRFRNSRFSGPEKLPAQPPRSRKRQTRTTADTDIFTYKNYDFENFSSENDAADISFQSAACTKHNGTDGKL